MKRVIFIVCIYFLSACGKSPKMVTVGKPSKKIVAQSASGFSTVSFLFVLDTSGSMNEIRKGMAQNFQRFFTIIQKYPNYNYNFAITTMSPKYGFSLPDQPPLFTPKLEKFDHCEVDPKLFIRNTNMGNYFRYKTSSANPESFNKISCLLSQTISTVTGYDDQSNEWYFTALNYLIQFGNKQFAKNFFSARNLLVIIFVSDAIGDLTEKNYHQRFLNSTTGRESVLRVGNKIGLDEFKNLVKHKTDNVIKAYGVIPGNLEACGEGKISSGVLDFPAHAYNFIDKTGGKSFSVCAGNNWGQDLTVIAEDLKEFLYVPKFLFEELPLVDTIKVFYNNHELENNTSDGWYYNPETVSIHIGKNFNYHEYELETNENVYSIEYSPLNPSIFYKNK